MIEPNYTYKATLAKVVDGDTIDVLLDAGFDITLRLRLRLLGVNTPERGQDGYYAATEYTREYCLGQQLLVRTVKDDSFGRYLAEVYRQGAEESLNQSLLTLGLADPYTRS